MDNTILILACIEMLGMETPVEVVYKIKCRGQLKKGSGILLGYSPKKANWLSFD